MTDDAFFDEIRRFLHASRTASLATVDELGHAHAANVQFAVDERLHLLFVSSAASAHSKHAAIDPLVAMTVYGEAEAPAKIHGLQLHGRCEMVVGADAIKHAFDVYARRFTFLATDAAMAQRVMQEQFYRVIPTWLRWIDNRRGFGFKKEMTMMV